MVETSGLALPRPLLQALAWPAIRKRVHVNGVVTVVDGEALSAGSPVGDPQALERQRQEDPNLDHLTAIDDLFRDQLEAADLVLISRSDCLDSSQRDSVEQQLAARVRAGTATLSISRGVVDPALVLGLKVSDHGIEHDHSHHADHSHHDHSSDQNDGGHLHHDHTHVEAISGQIRLQGSFERAQLEDLLRAFVIEHDVIRVKGRLWIPGKSLPLQIQMVGPRLESWFEVAPNQVWMPDEGSGLELVVIGLQSDSAARLERCLHAV